MGAGVWNKVKNFFRDVGNGMQIVLKPVSQILSMIPNPYTEIARSMIPNPYTEIASMITGGISALTDPDTYDTISEAVDNTNKVLYGK